MKKIVGFKIVYRHGLWPFVCRFLLPKKVPIETISRTGRLEYYDAKIGQPYILKFRNVRFVYKFSGTYLQMIRYRG